MRADGRYNALGEDQLGVLIASALMAFWCWLVYETARLWLSSKFALALSLVAALGTQAMSTSSRALWSDTYGIVILQAILLIVLRGQRSRRFPQPFLLATLLSWLYFVRPTHSISIVAVMGLLLVFRLRWSLVKTAFFGGGWLLAFVVFSRHYYLSSLPPYYQPARLDFSSFGTALLGNLVSPARGLLVYFHAPPAVRIFVALAPTNMHLSFDAPPGRRSPAPPDYFSLEIVRNRTQDRGRKQTC